MSPTLERNPIRHGHFVLLTRLLLVAILITFFCFATYGLGDIFIMGGFMSTMHSSAFACAGQALTSMGLKKQKEQSGSSRLVTVYDLREPRKNGCTRSPRQ